MVDFLYHNPTRTQLLRLPVTQFEGLSLPDLDHLAARGPHQHGATYVATYLRPRELSLQFYLRGCDAKEFESRHRDLVQYLDPSDAGELWVYGADGIKYTLAVHLAAALTVNRFSSSIAQVLAQFTADDPYFKTASQTQAFNTAVGTGTTIPQTVPFTISGSGNLVSIVVNNTGSEVVYPIIQLSAPAKFPQMKNLSVAAGTLSLNRLIGVGAVNIDMGAQTVIYNGVSILGDVAGDFWALIPGNNTLRFTTEDPAVMSGSINWTPRYLSIV